MEYELYVLYLWCEPSYVLTICLMWGAQSQETGVWVVCALFMMRAKLLGHSVNVLSMNYMFDVRSPVARQGSMSCVYVLYVWCEPSYWSMD